MDFLFEVKFKNGEIKEIRIRANIANEAIKLLQNGYRDVVSYKLLS